MRIALLSSDISEKQISGPRQSLSALASHLERCGAIAHVYTSRTLSGFFYRSVFIRALQGFSQSSYDVVVINGIYSIPLVRALMRCRLSGTKAIIAPRGSFMLPALGVKKRAFLAGIWPVVRGVPNHFLSDDEASNSLRTSRSCFISPNGTDYVGEPLRLSRMPRNPVTVFGFIGRLDVQHKGLDLLLRAADRLAMEGFVARFLLRGPVYRDFMATYARWKATASMPQVVEIGGPLTSDSDKSTFLRSIDYFIHPSRYEGVPQSCLEAMAYGVPVVASRTCNLRAFLPSYPAPLIHEATPQGTYEAYREALRLGQGQHAWLAAKVHAAAEQHFQWGKIARDYIELISELHWPASRTF